jgi:hypothetical protein
MRIIKKIKDEEPQTHVVNIDKRNKLKNGVIIIIGILTLGFVSKDTLANIILGENTGKDVDIRNNLVLKGSMTQSVMTEPSTPSTPASDDIITYVRASGTTPNREIVYALKNESGNEFIISSSIV